MSLTTTDAHQRLRMLGQGDLGAWIEIGLQEPLWSVQRRISSAVSKHRSRVSVPSCNASGKTWLAARLALAFYDCFAPGTPCVTCNGPCHGAKVITTSSKFDHLRNNLWSEMRLAYAQAQRRGLTIPGRMFIGNTLRLEDDPGHFIVGHSPNAAEGMQGYHAAHKLILGDEATSLDEQMQQGITGLLSSGDSRLCLIFNPTTPDTFAAIETRSPMTTVIKITAWDTPHFTEEEAPGASNLVSPAFLEELQAKGMGPGTYEWTTRVEAKFWDLADDNLVPEIWYDRAIGADSYEGTRAIGVDLASYGNAENVIAYRDGNKLTRIDAFPSMRPDSFWEGPVTQAVKRCDPHYLVYDADGVGAGVIGYAETAARHMTNGQLMPFRGGIKVSTKFLNARSAWWWNLRRRFENQAIGLFVHDDKLRKQVTSIRYTITSAGDIRVETKEEMRKRGVESPDRGDALMYAFALTDELPVPAAPSPTPMTDQMGYVDRSPEAMFKRDKERMEARQQKLFRNLEEDLEWDR